MLKVLLLVILSMVNWSFAYDDLFQPGDVHLEEKSYWYECETTDYGGRKSCEFKKCIMNYDQNDDGPMNCMTPKQLYDFHKEKGTLDALSERNCYEIRKIYSEDYIDAPKYPCIDPNDVANKPANKKSICNLIGNPKVTHKYDYGFYECENNEDFVLQGCEFESGQCSTYNDIQAIVNEQDELKTIVNRVKNERDRGQTPRTECYELRDHPLLKDTKNVCYDEYKQKINWIDITDEPKREDEAETSSTTTTTVEPTTTTPKDVIIPHNPDDTDYNPDEDI